MTYFCETCTALVGTWKPACPKCRSRLALRPLDRDVDLDDVVHTLDSQGDQRPRVRTRVSVLDTITNGGFPLGSRTCFYARKGLGKTTLCVQLAAATDALYLSGEQPAEEINAIASRLGLRASDAHVVDTDDVDVAVRAIERYAPRVVIGDSWNTLWSEHVDGMPGTFKQMRYALDELGAFEDVALVLVAQVGKDGLPAVREKLLHAVDGVFTLRDAGDPKRILKVVKSRYCARTSLAITMTPRGFRATRSPHLELVE